MRTRRGFHGMKTLLGSALMTAWLLPQAADAQMVNSGRAVLQLRRVYLSTLAAL